jgi:hypothetical protein
VSTRGDQLPSRRASLPRSTGTRLPLLSLPTVLIPSLLCLGLIAGCAGNSYRGEVLIETVAVTSTLQPDTHSSPVSVLTTRIALATEPAGTPTPLAPLESISIAFDKRYAPGSFAGPPADYVPYRFIVAGYLLAGLSAHRPLGELSPQPLDPPFFAVKEGNALLVYLPPSTIPGVYTLTIRTPEGQVASATFTHSR